MWVQLCFVHRGAGRDMTNYWGSTVESVVPDFKPKAWWDFLLETPGREMTITGESDFSPGLSSSTTLVQPTSRVIFPMGDGSYSYCLLLTLVSGLKQRIRFPSLFKFGPLWWQSRLVTSILSIELNSLNDKMCPVLFQRSDKQTCSQHNCYCREDWSCVRVELCILLQRSSTAFFVARKMQIILISDLSHQILGEIVKKKYLNVDEVIN